MISSSLMTDTAKHSSFTGVDEYQDESFGTEQTLTDIRVRTTEELTNDSMGSVRKSLYTFYFDFDVSTPTTYTVDSFKEGDKIVYGTKELRIRTVMPAKSTAVQFVKFTAV